MLPTIFPLLSASATVTALIGSSPVRAFLHGVAPQGVTSPYVTWALVGGAPENNVSDLPPADLGRVQVDCWSEDAAQVIALATAVRDAIEGSHHMVTTPSFGRDPETMKYRATLEFDCWTNRP